MDELELNIIEKFFRTPLNSDYSFNNLAIYLESLLYDPCTVIEIEGELELIEIKALVDNVRGMKIDIYPNEHQPPHFHVRSSTFQASFRIDDCSIIQGSIEGSSFRKILYWHKHSKDRLIKKWNTTRPTNCVVGKYME